MPDLAPCARTVARGNSRTDKRGPGRDALDRPTLSENRDDGSRDRRGQGGVGRRHRWRDGRSPLREYGGAVACARLEGEKLFSGRELGQQSGGDDALEPSLPHGGRFVCQASRRADRTRVAVLDAEYLRSPGRIAQAELPEDGRSTGRNASALVGTGLASRPVDQLKVGRRRDCEHREAGRDACDRHEDSGHEDSGHPLYHFKVSGRSGAGQGRQQ